MSDIYIPNRFEDLTDDSTKEFYVDQNDIFAVEDLSDSDILSHIDGINNLCDEQDLSELNKDHIDIIYSILRGVSPTVNLSEAVISALFESLIALVKQAIKVYSLGGNESMRNPAKIVVYFLQVLCQRFEITRKMKESNEGTADGNTSTKIGGKSSGKASKKSINNGIDWPQKRFLCLELFQKFLQLDSHHLWDMGVIQENFLIGFWKYAIQVLEDPNNSNASKACVSILSQCITAYVSSNHSKTCNISGITSTIITSIVQNERSPATVGNFCRDVAELCKEANIVFLTELLKEFGAMNMAEKSKVKTAIPNIKVFLVKLAETIPELMTQYLSFIIDLVDCETYGIRNALLEMMAELIGFIHQRGLRLADAPSIINAPQSPARSEDGIVEGNEGGVEDEARHTERLYKLRDNMFDALTLRIHDSSAFVRCCVLKVWTDLVQNDLVADARFSVVADLVAGRLLDKAVLVRKAAMTLLTAMLDHNPFGSSLNMDTYKAQQSMIEQAMKHRLQTISEENNDVPATTASKPGETEAEGGEDEEVDEELTPEELDALAEADDVMVGLRKAYEKTSLTVSFLTVIGTAVSLIKTMVHSKTNTDVIEAQKFFMRAVNFGIHGSLPFLISTFSLIWHQEESIRHQCLETFKHVFLTDGAMDHPSPQPPDTIARDLMKLCKECDRSTFASLEQILEVVMTDKSGTLLDEDFIDCVWQIIKSLAAAQNSDATVAGAPAQGPMSDMAAALYLASILIKARPALMTEKRLQLVVSSGLGAQVIREKDFHAIKAAAKCMQAVAVRTPNVAEQEGSLWVAIQSAEHPLKTVLYGGWVGEEDGAVRTWFSACEECMHALFHLHRAPEKIAAAVVTQQYADIGGYSAITSAAGSRISVPVTKLARLVFVIGQLSLCAVVFTEKLAKDAKKINSDSKVAQDTTAIVTPAVTKSKHGSALTKAATGVNQDDGFSAMEEEMGMVAAADAEHEKLLDQITELELVKNPDNLLGKMHPIVAFLVANDKGAYSHPLLQEVTLLALCRMMSVSSLLCEEYLPLLFTVLERRKLSPVVRTTVMIALGDLAFRFPNALEPWTARMYSRLGDRSPLVRYNTLMVLTHLILNDMIKVKGQVSQIVLCLVDPIEAVKGLAALFFTELSRRSNNPVYNLLGDIIGSLTGNAATGTAVNVPEDLSETCATRVLTPSEFQQTMTFLLKFINKDKQADSLLERLLVRMETACSGRQQTYLAFCISQLPITEKGVRKMIELIRHYKDALHDSEVREFLLKAAEKAKKGGIGEAAVDKDSVRVAIDEFQRLVSETIGDSEIMRMNLDGETFMDMDEGSTMLSTTGAGLEDTQTSVFTKASAKSKASKRRGQAAADKSTSFQGKKAAPKKKKQPLREWSDDEDFEQDGADTNVTSGKAKGRGAGTDKLNSTAGSVRQTSRQRKQVQEIHYGSENEFDD